MRAIDLNAKRITIAYDAVDALNWPRGTMPFSVYQASLLQGVTVGEKVRFRLDSQRISDLKPFDPAKAEGARVMPRLPAGM